MNAGTVMKKMVPEAKEASSTELGDKFSNNKCNKLGEPEGQKFTDSIHQKHLK